jgi:8-oxo-dGTP pyrophosphatase MutT (NUDIX family)
MKIRLGDRVGRSGRLVVGCCGALFDFSGRLLLTRRSDNGEWCLPGGRMDPGESAVEACIREVREETGYDVSVTHLIGVYTSPNFIVDYENGDQVQVVGLSFALQKRATNQSHSAEVLEQGFFSADEVSRLTVMTLHSGRIQDAFSYNKIAEYWIARFD